MYILNLAIDAFRKPWMMYILNLAIDAFLKAWMVFILNLAIDAFTVSVCFRGLNHFVLGIGFCKGKGLMNLAPLFAIIV